MPDKVPNPGSDEALNLGCLCPVLDNGHGRGYLGSENFVVALHCPIHNKKKDDDTKPRAD